MQDLEISYLFVTNILAKTLNHLKKEKEHYCEVSIKVKVQALKLNRLMCIVLW